MLEYLYTYVWWLFAFSLPFDCTIKQSYPTTGSDHMNWNQYIPEMEVERNGLFACKKCGNQIL